MSALLPPRRWMLRLFWVASLCCLSRPVSGARRRQQAVAEEEGLDDAQAAERHNTGILLPGLGSHQAEATALLSAAASSLEPQWHAGRGAPDWSPNSSLIASTSNLTASSASAQRLNKLASFSAAQRGKQLSKSVASAVVGRLVQGDGQCAAQCEGIYRCYPGGAQAKTWECGLRLELLILSSLVIFSVLGMLTALPYSQRRRTDDTKEAIALFKATLRRARKDCQEWVRKEEQEAWYRAWLLENEVLSEDQEQEAAEEPPSETRGSDQWAHVPTAPKKR